MLECTSKVKNTSRDALQVDSEEGDPMQLFLHSQGSGEAEIVTVDEATIVRTLVGEGTDHRIWIAEQEEEVQLDISFAEAGIHNHHHVHRGHCHRLHADVRFMTDHGIEHKQDDVRPVATIGEVLDWAAGDRGFNLPTDKRPDYVLALPDAKEYLATDVRVITLVDDECTVRLDLLPKDHFGG
jgi:hypothetical protein